MTHFPWIEGESGKTWVVKLSDSDYIGVVFYPNPGYWWATGRIGKSSFEAHELESAEEAMQRCEEWAWPRLAAKAA